MLFKLFSFKLEKLYLFTFHLSQLSRVPFTCGPALVCSWSQGAAFQAPLLSWGLANAQGHGFAWCWETGSGLREQNNGV